MLKPGFYVMGNQDYHTGRGAFAESKSSLSSILPPDGSPKKFKWHKDNPEILDIFDVKCEKFNNGTAFHTWFNEKEKFNKEIVVYKPFKGKGSVALNDELKQSIRDAGQTPIKADVLEMLQEFDTVIHSGEYEEARKVIEAEDRFVEYSGFWQDPETGIWLKTRPDIVTHDQVIWDLKKHSNIKSFRNEAINLHYDLQAHMALVGVSAITGMEHINFGFIIFHAFEKPYEIEILMADGDFLNSGKEKFETATLTLKGCLDTDKWPGKYADYIDWLGVPGWRKRQLENLII